MRPTHALLIAVALVVGCSDAKTDSSATESKEPDGISKSTSVGKTTSKSVSKSSSEKSGKKQASVIEKPGATSVESPAAEKNAQPGEYVEWLRSLDSGDEQVGIVLSVQNRPPVLTSLRPLVALAVGEDDKSLLPLFEVEFPSRFAYGINVGLTENPIFQAIWSTFAKRTGYPLDEHHDPATSQPKESELDPYTPFVKLSGSERTSQIVLEHESKHDLVAVFSQPALEVIVKHSHAAIFDKKVADKLAGIDKHVKQALLVVDWLDSISIRAVFVTTDVEKTQQLLGLVQEYWRSEIGKVTQSVADLNSTDEERAAAAIRLGKLTTAYGTLDYVASDKLLEIRLSLPID